MASISNLLLNSFRCGSNIGSDGRDGSLSSLMGVFIVLDTIPEFFPRAADTLDTADVVLVFSFTLLRYSCRLTWSTVI